LSMEHIGEVGCPSPKEGPPPSYGR
jgi:hypothetical protein